MTETETAAELVLDAPAIFAEWMKGHGLSLRYEFVPYSKSRNAPSKESPKGWRSLNWKVTLLRTVNGRESVVLETNYSAGTGHCPTSRKPPLHIRPGTAYYEEMIAFECEEGFPALWLSGVQRPMRGSVKRPIVPDDRDVMHSLASDADVMNYRDFEDYAANMGDDPDSRKAEASYKACLAIALALRNGIGESALAELQGIARD